MFYQLLAQAESKPPAPTVTDMLLSMWWLPVIVLVFWLFIIAPQRKKDRQREELRKSLKKNDKVVTIGGIHGVVKSLTEDEVVLLVDEAKDVKMKFSRQSVLNVEERPSEDEKDQ